MQFILRKTITLGLFLFGLGFSSLSLAHDLSVTSLDQPTPVKTNQKPLIVYELHIINNGSTTQRIGRIEAKDENDRQLMAYSGSKLVENSFVYKEGKRIKENEVELEPGMGVFVYMWIVLDKNSPLPTNLTNQIWATQVNTDKSKVKMNTLTYNLPVRKEPPPVLGAPLKGDHWLAVASIANDSYHRRTILPVEGNFYLAQRFAIDWEKIHPNGWEFKGNMHKNKNWLAYGHEVLAVDDGTIVNMRDAIPADNTPPGLPNPPPNFTDTPGNFVILKIQQNGRDYYVLYAHMQPKSIKVHLGDTIKKGQVIGILGNTGNSGAPHLHLQVSDANDPIKSNGLPFVFEKFKFMGTAGDIDERYGIFLPQYAKDPKVFKHVFPRVNTLVEFE